MPRRSAADLAVIRSIKSVPRLRAPATLTARQKAHFTALVASVPAERLRPVDLPLLVTLCRHLGRAEEIEGQFATVVNTDDFDTLSAMAARESSRIASILTKLRLTPQARYVPDSRKLRPREGTPPWEVDGE